MRTEEIQEGRVSWARIGTAVCFLLTGFVSASWASRVPAIKGGLDLGDGQFAIALLVLEAGAVGGLQLGGLMVPRTGSRLALVVSLVAVSFRLILPALPPARPFLRAGM